VLVVPLWWIWPHAVTLLWVQSLAVVVGEGVAFIWMCEVAASIVNQRRPVPVDKPKHGRKWSPFKSKVDLSSVVLILGLVLLIADTWIYWAISFDFHLELVGACFAMLFAYDLAHHNRRAWLWFVLTLTSGDVAITYAVGVGLSAILAGKQWRRQGIATLVLALGAFGLTNVLGFDRGSGVAEYLVGAKTSVNASGKASSSAGIGGLSSLFHALASRPLVYLRTLRAHILNIYANIAPAGFIGLASAWGFGVPIVVLLENNLRVGVLFSITPFQNFPLYLFVALGTVMVLVQVANRWRILSWVLVAVILGSSIGWFVTWFPKTSDTWLRVSPAAAAVLNRTLAKVPLSDQIAVTHGVVGAFSERQNLTVFQELTVPVLTHPVWFVLAPAQGIETVSVERNLENIAYLAGPLHAKLVSHGGGVWVFRWNPPPRTTQAVFPNTCSTVPAWALSTPVGRASVAGPSTTWGVESTGAAGYVVDGDYWRLAGGSFVAAVRTRADGPMSVQVWDADRGVLVAQRQIPSTHGEDIVKVPFQVAPSLARPLTEGAGPFRVNEVPPPREDQYEVRVVSPGATAIQVSSITVLPSSQTSHLIGESKTVC
jgi:uncharacterized membrane protein